MLAAMALQTAVVHPMWSGCGPASRIKKCARSLTIGLSVLSAAIAVLATMLPLCTRCGPELRAVYAAWGFCGVHSYGHAGSDNASDVSRVRPRLQKSARSGMFLVSAMLEVKVLQIMVILIM